MGIQKLPSIWAALITLMAKGAYSLPTSGYWLALAYSVENMIASMNPIVGIRTHRAVGPDAPIRERPRATANPGIIMNILRRRARSDNLPPIGPPSMAANIMSEAISPAWPVGI